jgi:hypothetical protein
MARELAKSWRDVLRFFFKLPTKRQDIRDWRVVVSLYALIPILLLLWLVLPLVIQLVRAFK